MEEGGKTQQEKVDILLQLPLEVALHILAYCRAHDLLQFQLVCSAWARWSPRIPLLFLFFHPQISYHNSLAKEEEAWKQLVQLTRAGATLPSPDIKSWRDFYMTLKHDPVYVTCVSIGDVGVCCILILTPLTSHLTHIWRLARHQCWKHTMKTVSLKTIPPQYSPFPTPSPPPPKYLSLPLG